MTDWWWLIVAALAGFGAGLFTSALIRAIVLEAVMYGWNGIRGEQTK